MRTTITLDDDLVPKLKRVAHLRGISWKEAVNSVLRRGLSGPETKLRSQFRVHTFRSPFRAGVDMLHLNRLADDLELKDRGRGRR